MTPQLFFRFDDIGPLSRSSLRFVDLMESLERPYVLAVIPDGLSWLMKRPLRATRHAKIYQHGIDHKNRSSNQLRDELPDSLGHERIMKNLMRGRERLADALQREITGYVPPWNHVSDIALRILEQQGFECISANRPLTTTLTQLPIHIDVYERYQPVVVRNNHEVQNEITQSMAATPLTGVMLHPLSVPRRSFSQMEKLIRQNHSVTISHAAWQRILKEKDAR